MKINLIILFLLITLSAAASGCGAQTRDITITDIKITTLPKIKPTPTFTPYPFRTSQTGLTTVKGILLVVSPDVILPDPEDAIYLVPLDTTQMVSGIPAFTKKEVPQADVDETDGSFVFTDIKPGTYAVVVYSKGGSQIPARYYGKSGIAIVKVTEQDKNKTVDLEKLSFP